MRSRAELWKRWAPALAVALLLGCDAGGFGPVVDDVQPSLLVYAEVGATAVTGLAVDVSASDMGSTLTYALPVRAGVAAGTIRVPVGRERLITVRAHDGEGRESHRGTVTTEVLASDNPPLEIMLVSLDGEGALTATVGSMVVVVSPAADTLDVGGTVGLTATAYDSLGENVHNARFDWATLAHGVAEVDNNGRVTAKSPGTAPVVAIFRKENLGGSAQIVVRGEGSEPPPSGETGTLEISPSESALDGIGSKASLAATATDADGSTITNPGIQWKSLNTSIATVDANGVVTAQAVGTAAITAAAECCSPDSATVIVDDPTPPPSSRPPDANRFIDGLESTLKDGRDPTGINVDGFRWTSGAGTPFSIVRDDGCVVHGTSGPINPPNCGFESRQWENAPDGTDGRHAARFRYPANDAGFAEQRFDLGAVYSDVWFRFWIRVPVNFVHENVGGPSSSNNKFFALWMDGYEGHGNGPTVVWEYWPDGSRGSRLAVRTYNPTTGHLQHKQFISTPADRGRWMQVVLHVKAATGTGANNGVIQSWRRWADEASFTKFHEILDADIPPPASGPNGWQRGYFLGASNSWWAAETEFLTDRFEVSTDPLVPAMMR